jgi:hypothetical protein
MPLVLADGFADMKNVGFAKYYRQNARGRFMSQQKFIVQAVRKTFLSHGLLR